VRASVKDVGEDLMFHGQRLGSPANTVPVLFFARIRSRFVHTVGVSGTINITISAAASITTSITTSMAISLLLLTAAVGSAQRPLLHRANERGNNPEKNHLHGGNKADSFRFLSLCRKSTNSTI
jgi:hypothetical protein